MKQIFSTNWIKSKQPRKQRKYRHNAPLHLKREFLAAHLSKELRTKYGIRSVILRKGDKVKIMRGQFKGKVSKVDRVSIVKERVYVQGAERLKRDGSKSFYPINPSNVMVQEINLDDRKRKEKLQKKVTKK